MDDNRSQDAVVLPVDEQGTSNDDQRPQLTRSILSGAGALGMASGLERGLGFFANVLAARLGGASVFGAYSIAVTSANNIAAYAGAGIGNTSARFIAEHAPGSRNYNKVVRTLAYVSISSALIAAVALWLGAGPMARLLLRNEALRGPLRVAALSASALVLLECCKGVLIGTRNARHLVMIAVVAGLGLLLAVPGAARFGPSAMLAGQSIAVLIAVGVAASLILRPAVVAANIPQREVAAPSVGGVWKFGLVQLLGVIGLNGAGWWTAAQVARADSTLAQTAFYSVAFQLRNLGSLLPNLISQGNFAFFTDEGSASFGGAEQVVTASTIVASALAIVCTCGALILLPVILSFYGHGYSTAELAAGIAISTIMVHLGTAPAAMRLMVASLRWTGSINTIWSILVVAGATYFVPYGGAAAATATMFGAHILSMILTTFALWKLDSLPKGLVAVTILNIGVALVFVGLAWARATHRGSVWEIDALLLGTGLASLLWCLRFGQSCGVLPKLSDLASMISRKARVVLGQAA